MKVAGAGAGAGAPSPPSPDILSGELGLGGLGFLGGEAGGDAGSSSVDSAFEESVEFSSKWVEVSDSGVSSLLSGAHPGSVAEACLVVGGDEK